MDNSKQDSKVLVEINNKIARVKFFNSKSNSFPSHQLNSLISEFDKLAKNAEISVIVLESEGEKVFSAGASFDELLAIENLEEAKDFFYGFGRLILSMRSCPKLILTKVQGKAVGGGVGIIAASDYVIAHTSASIKLSELSIGFAPFVIAPIIESKLGKSAFANMAIDADWRDAEWAKENGLYAQVCSTQEELNNKVDELAKKIADYNLDAVLNFKSILNQDIVEWKNLLADRALTSAKLSQSEFTQEILRNFKK
ncbi:MAG: enoyl-CoA hydratase/isomerase family protein [Bdellovibrionales bacterium]|nr:enoyl-CoA hydratase/isomerase family protein [Bdellovibrionales bacterium]